MVREHVPLVTVRDADGRYAGVVTLSRVMAAVLRAAGSADDQVERTLNQDLLDLDRDRRRGP
jgi:hypothetical protein